MGIVPSIVRLNTNLEKVCTISILGMLKIMNVYPDEVEII